MVGLVALGCGTAIASVCAIGLFQVERLLGGIWSAAAVATAGACCLALARAFARLNAVLPSGAGLLAQLSRAHGRRAGLLAALPYLALTLFLVGAEANIVGALLGRLLGAPAWLGAGAFLLGTWLISRAGVKVGLRAQAWATWALVAALAALSLHALHGAHLRGLLAARLLPPFPGAAHFAAGVGQAVFLFMGFELITSQAEVTATPAALGRALPGCVAVLTGFYALLSLGFSCVDAAPTVGLFVPQLAVAEQAGAPGAVLLVALLSLLASFTSFNGALLGLARFAYALAAQGLLPRSLARLDPKTLLPPRILAALLVLSLGATAAVGLGGMLVPSILAGAASAACVYASAAWAREQAPFAEPGRGRRWLGGLALVVVFAALGVGAVLDAGPALAPTLGLLAAAYGLGLAAALRAGPRPAPAPREVAHAD